MNNVRPWIDLPNLEELLRLSNLNEQNKGLVKFFAENGYLVIDPGIHDFKAKAEGLIQSLAGQYKGQRRLLDAWQSNNYVRSLAAANEILSILKILYQAEPIPFQTLNFPVGTQQPTHSDTIHFHCIPHGFMCGVWIALEDIDLENGPLHYYPGSHRLPFITPQDIGVPYDGGDHKPYKYYEKFVENFLSNSGLHRVELELKQGMVLIWAANLFHGGSTILNKTRSRHSQVTHYFFTDCLYYTPLCSDPFSGKMLIKDVVNIATGKKVPHFYQGSYFSTEELYSNQRRVVLGHQSQDPDILLQNIPEREYADTQCSNITQEETRAKNAASFSVKKQAKNLLDKLKHFLPKK